MSEVTERDLPAAAEWMTQAIEAAKNLKTAAMEVAKKHNQDKVDIPVMLTGYREGETVVSVVADEMGDDVSICVGLMLSGARCDQITCLSEGLSTHTEINPETGVEWEPQDMEFLLGTNPELAAEAGVHSCLFLHLINRPEHPLSHSDAQPHYCVVVPYEVKDGQLDFDLDEGIRCHAWGGEDDLLAIPGTEFFLTQDTMHEQIKKDIANGNIPLDTENYLAMEGEFGIDLLVDVFTVKQLNSLGAVKAAGLMFPKEGTRYEIFQKIIGGDVDLDPFEALGINAEGGWKVKRLTFSDGVVEDLG